MERSSLRRAARWTGTGLGVLAAAAALLWATAPDASEYADAWPERTAYMELRVRQAREAGRELSIDYRPVPLSRIPEEVRRAVRVAEDAAFYQHGGVDWHEVRAAIREAWREEEAPRGASTLTMQLARNLYLSPERSLRRKLREVVIARKMEAELGKRRILELYLNVIELGPGVFGVEAAARRYWGTSVSAIGPERAAELAATIPSPRDDNPATRTRRFSWRSSLIARRAFEDRAGADTAGTETRSGRYPPAESLPPDTARPGVPALPAPDTAARGAAGRDTGSGAASPADTAARGGGGGAQPSDTAAVPSPEGGRKKGSHFSRGDGSVSRLTTTSRVIEAITPGMTM